jgi:hypothetical protein
MKRKMGSLPIPRERMKLSHYHLANVVQSSPVEK